MTSTAKPRASRYSITSDQRAPAPTRNRLASGSRVMCASGSMSITTPPGEIVCPPMVCRAPAIETGRSASRARRRSSASCSSARAGSAGTGQRSAILVRFRRLASSASSGVNTAGAGSSLHSAPKRCAAGRSRVAPSTIETATSRTAMRRRWRVPDKPRSGMAVRVRGVLAGVELVAVEVTVLVAVDADAHLRAEGHDREGQLAARSGAGDQLRRGPLLC